MKLGAIAGATLAAFVLGGCALTQGASDTPFDPAACYEREFSVYFDGLDTRLSREAREVIDAAGHSVRGCRIEQVRIVGSADTTGGDEVSEEVSIERARTIADYLSRTVGWPRDKFTLAATGDRGAVTEEGLNRPMRRRGRVIVTALAPDSAVPPPPPALPPPPAPAS